MAVYELIIRLAIAFFTLLLLTRILGRKELTQMTFFNFVSGIALGNLGVSLAINPSISIRNGLIGLILWSFFTISMGLLDIKSPRMRVALEGQPLILIKNGNIMEKELRRARLDIDELKALLREKNAFSVSEVDYAIFETSGKLSVLKKEYNQPVTKQEMNVMTIPSAFSPVSTKVIADGRMNTANLHKLNLTKQWVEKQIKQAGIPSVSEVFYAELQKDGTLYIALKE
ncbi:DUF421 domain-containing protein [Halobacillus andaensis]|uniref:DUF421 domain-containing protein n=1 Tax=Halobacillus andaensis TaxID=1176239 RepID=UPI003D70F77E